MLRALLLAQPLLHALSCHSRLAALAAPRRAAPRRPPSRAAPRRAAPQYDPTHKLETPCNVELKNTSRYQIRVYGISGESWSTAAVKADNFSSATSAGFYKNFAYIQGANVPKTKIPMTAPVATRTHDEKNWLVSFFTPTSLYPSYASVPQPTDPDVRIENFPLSTFAVVEFGGEAFEADYKIANALLKAALVEDGVTLAPVTDDWAEVWCGYDAPNDIFNRHNEAWIRVVLCACICSSSPCAACKPLAPARRRARLVPTLFALRPFPCHLYTRRTIHGPTSRAVLVGWGLRTHYPTNTHTHSSITDTHHCIFDFSLCNNKDGLKRFAHSHTARLDRSLTQHALAYHYSATASCSMAWMLAAATSSAVKGGVRPGQATAKSPMWTMSTTSSGQCSGMKAKSSFIASGCVCCGRAAVRGRECGKWRRQQHSARRLPELTAGRQAKNIHVNTRRCEHS